MNFDQEHYTLSETIHLLHIFMEETEKKLLCGEPVPDDIRILRLLIGNSVVHLNAFSDALCSITKIRDGIAMAQLRRREERHVKQ